MTKRPHHFARGAMIFVWTAMVGVAAQAMQPLVTDDSGTQGPGGQQLEFSYTHDRASAVGETSNTHAIDAAYTYGVIDTVDVFLQPSYSREQGGPRGWGNTVAGGKWRFYGNADNGTSLALKGELAMPVSRQRESDGLGTGKASGAVTLIMSQQVPFGFVHVNVAGERDRYRASLAQADETHWRVSAAPVWQVAPGWQLALDVGYETVRAGGEHGHSRFGELGVVYSPNETVDFALGLLRQFSRDPGADASARTTSITTGATIHF